MKIEKGTKLIEIDPCEMRYEYYGTPDELLTVGKEYTVRGFDENGHVVIDEDVHGLTFTRQQIDSHFKLADNTPDSSLLDV